MGISSKRKLMILEMIFAVIVVCSNAVNAKVVQFDLFSFQVILPGSALYYIFTFLISNLISESYGPNEAKTCVKQGIVAQAVATIIFISARMLPAQDQAIQSSFIDILGKNWVFVVADITACLISHFSQILVFNNLRNNSKLDSRFRNMISMILSQCIDTFVFLGVAFGLGFMWFATPEGQSQLLSMFVCQYIVKCLVVIIMTPAFPVLVKMLKEGNEDERDIR